MSETETRIIFLDIPKKALVKHDNEEKIMYASYIMKHNMNHEDNMIYLILSNDKYFDKCFEKLNFKRYLNGVKIDDNIDIDIKNFEGSIGTNHNTLTGDYNIYYTKSIPTPNSVINMTYIYPIQMQHKNAIFFLPSCTNTKQNEFESCRGEGRAIFNIAFGFSLLGYECHIINSWNLQQPKQIWKNVFIYHTPIIEKYDVAMTYDNISILNSENYKNKIVMTYESSNIEKINRYINEHGVKNVILACSHRSTKDPSTNPFNLRYFPVLFPIPSINLGFVQYTNINNNNELKIYIYHSSWAGTASGSSWRYVTKQKLIIEYLLTKYKTLNLSIHVESQDIANTCPFGYPTPQIKINYITNNINYEEVLNHIRNSDLCISTGGLNHAGNNVLDIISLGKPLILIYDGAPYNENNVRFSPWNILYDCDPLIYLQEPDSQSIGKLNNIFNDNNLEKLYNCYKNTLKDYDFNNWKPIVENFLSQL